MTRHRARPSFTVEIKRPRSSALPFQDDPDRQRAAQSLWRGTPLAEARAHVLESTFAVSEPRPDPGAIFADRTTTTRTTTPGTTSKAEPAGPSRRVLPSLIQPEPEPVAAPVVAEAPVEAAPRPARAARPALTARRTPAPREAAPASPGPVEAPRPAPQPMPAAVIETAEGAPERRHVPRGRQALKAGERWKRRLPRILW